MLAKLNFTSLLLLLSAAFSGHVLAESSGKVLFEQCAACHGINGEGNDALKSPVIAGQEASYILRQITNYAQEIRGKSELAKPMVAIAKTISSAEDLAILAAYIEKLPVSKTNNIITGDLKNGSRYYQAKCGACHGGQAQGNKTFNAPKLANQSSQYLRQQMQDFKAGDRGYDQKDKLGRQMAIMANTTKGQELSDILYYIAAQDIEAQAKR